MILAKETKLNKIQDNWQRCCDSTRAWRSCCSLFTTLCEQKCTSVANEKKSDKPWTESSARIKTDSQVTSRMGHNLWTVIESQQWNSTANSFIERSFMQWQMSLARDWESRSWFRQSIVYQQRAIVQLSCTVTNLYWRPRCAPPCSCPSRFYLS